MEHSRTCQIGGSCRNGPDAEGARNFLGTSLGPTSSRSLTFWSKQEPLVSMANSVIMESLLTLSTFANYRVRVGEHTQTSRSHERPT
jgi:hypothetical protein